MEIMLARDVSLRYGRGHVEAKTKVVRDARGQERLNRSLRSSRGEKNASENMPS